MLFRNVTDVAAPLATSTVSSAVVEEYEKKLSAQEESLKDANEKIDAQQETIERLEGEVGELRRSMDESEEKLVAAVRCDEGFLGLTSSPYVTSTVSQSVCQSVRQTRFSYFPPLDFSDFLHQASLL